MDNGNKSNGFEVMETYGDGNVKLVKVRNGNWLSYKFEKSYFYKGEKRSTGLLKKSDLEEAHYVLTQFLAASNAPVEDHSED